MNGLDKRPECFVAMWFASGTEFEAEMDKLYSEVLKPAIEWQELSPYRVDKDLGADKLDDAILDAIDRATLVVADLTHDKKTGFRGNVVFEAGYAYKFKPMIWMCRDDLADSTPFDFRQFKQIRWKRDRLSEAKQQLADMIGERIRDRQNSKADHEIARYITNAWNQIIAIQDDNDEDTVKHAGLIRYMLFRDFLGGVKTRVKYKEMGLSQNNKYELLKTLHDCKSMMRPYSSGKTYPRRDVYMEYVHPILRSSGWLQSSQTNEGESGIVG